MNAIYSPKFNFHNASPIMLRLTGETAEYGECYRVSESQVRRLRTHFCGVAECKCNSAALMPLNGELTEWGIPVEFCQLTGNAK